MKSEFDIVMIICIQNENRQKKVQPDSSNLCDLKDIKVVRIFVFLYVFLRPTTFIVRLISSAFFVTYLEARTAECRLISLNSWLSDI